MVLLVFAVLLGSSPARAIDTGDISIVSLKGEVHVTMLGTERPVHAGSVLELPATLRTGRDGAVELRQGATSVNIGPDTLLDFPALAMQGGPIDRIVQSRGNAFYSVGKRPGRKLRVETPLLVGVVKGTQFNVAVQGDSSTFSLFEGLLEIRAADESSVVDIRAGEIAARHRGDANIGVLKMDEKSPPPPRAPAGAQGNRQSNDGAVPVALADADTDLRTPRVIPSVTSFEAGPAISMPVADIPAAVNAPGVNVPVAIEAPGGIDIGAGTGSVAAAVEIPVNVPVGNVDVGVSVGGVDLGASADLGGEDSQGNGNTNAGPGNNNGNAGEGNSGNGKGNGGTGSLNSGSANEIDVDSVLNGLLKKPGKK